MTGESRRLFLRSLVAKLITTSTTGAAIYEHVMLKTTCEAPRAFSFHKGAVRVSTTMEKLQHSKKLLVCLIE